MIYCMRFYFLFLLFIIGTSDICVLHAQLSERVFKTDYRIYPDKQGELSVEIDNLNFFKDNEYMGLYANGYTLPGFWLQTKAVYYPLDILKIEAGVYFLRFWGTDRYPNMAYQDIADWKGDQYKKGMHLLPWFRAQVALSGRVNIVLGSLYGGAHHNLTEPLYNPELNTSADPEMGIQLLYHSRPLDADIWINWESFIYEGDVHQEAFTAGLSSRLKFNPPESRLHFYMPLQAVIQHRGGEIDTIYATSVQTLANYAAGVGMIWNTGHKVFRNVNWEIDVAGYYQQADKLWPFDNGYGLYVRASADIYNFRVKASYWKCYDFISLFGSPFYGAVSTAYPGLSFDNPSLYYFGLEYSRVLAKGFSFGVDVDVYKHGDLTLIGNGSANKRKGQTNFSAGIYLRVNPSFLIKNSSRLVSK